MSHYNNKAVLQMKHFPQCNIHSLLWLCPITVKQDYRLITKCLHFFKIIRILKIEKHTLNMKMVEGKKKRNRSLNTDFYFLFQQSYQNFSNTVLLCEQKSGKCHFRQTERFLDYFTSASKTAPSRQNYKLVTTCQFGT